MTEITNMDDLLRLYGEVAPTTWGKQTNHLTKAYEQMILAAPFMLIATNGPERIDVSPRGDMAPLLQIEDSQTLLLPDRRGNNRIDTLRNILHDPRVGLLFMIPGKGEVLRVAGTAKIIADEALNQCFEMDGKSPVTVLKIKISDVYFQCARAVMRAGLWEMDARTDVPTAGEMIKQAVVDFNANDYDKILRGRQKKSLY